MSTRNEPEKSNRPNRPKQPDESDEPNEPNEEGFAGAATGPEVRIDDRNDHEEEAEEAAIPDSDLPRGISESLPGADDRGGAAASRPDNG